MNFKKVIAASLAGTMALAMSATAFAGNADSMLQADNNAVVLFGTDEATGEANGWLNMNGFDITAIYGVTYYVTYDQAELDTEDTWIGGGVGWNSTSTGWAATEYGKASGEKAIAIEDTLNGNAGTITVKSDAPVFTADDEWAQCWLQSWGGTVTVTGVDLLGADGQALVAGGTTTPEETTEAPAGDGSSETGDVTPVAVMAVIAACAGVALVASKKKIA